MKVMKKNQVVILVIALMLVTAGYLNFIETSKENGAVLTCGNNVETMGDATFVSSEALVSNDEIEDVESNVLENVSTTNETIDTSAKEETTSKKESDSSKEYFTKSKLERDTMYSQMIESYQKMLDSTTVSAEQKAIAQNEITKINETKNAIMITENLIKTKGFEDVVILVNNDSINIILLAEELKQEEVAQVQNIVSREMNAEIGNIHISSK